MSFQTGIEHEDSFGLGSGPAPLIVVSNRLPFVLKRDLSNGMLRRSHRYSYYYFRFHFHTSSVARMKWENIQIVDAFVVVFVVSAGGLVTALGPVVTQCGGLWIGWPGSHDVRPLDQIPEPETPGSGLKSNQVKAVLVHQELFDSFYNGCCNGTFWPLFHSMPDRAVFSSDTWKVWKWDA